VKDVKGLKNYGKSWIAAMNSMPEETKKEIRKRSMGVIRGRLTFFEMMKFGIRFFREKARMSKIDLTEAKRRGLTDERFIASQIEFAAIYSALSKTVGGEKALETLYAVIEATASPLFAALFPGESDFVELDDPWDAYKNYMMATMKADEADGCHVAEIVEDSDHAFQMDVTFCAWFETAKTLGVQEACLANCYGDDVVLPDALKPFGIQFKRTGTLAGGEDRCDFRFERTA
jgi:hypothetical protein